MWVLDSQDALRPLLVSNRIDYESHRVRREMLIAYSYRGHTARKLGRWPEGLPELSVAFDSLSQRPAGGVDL